MTTPQKTTLELLADGEWHTFGGRKSAMINRLGDAGLVQFRYHPRAPGMPERIDARIKPKDGRAGHVDFSR